MGELVLLEKKDHKKHEKRLSYNRKLSLFNIEQWLLNAPKSEYAGVILELLEKHRESDSCVSGDLPFSFYNCGYFGRIYKNPFRKGIRSNTHRFEKLFFQSFPWSG